MTTKLLAAFLWTRCIYANSCRSVGYEHQSCKNSRTDQDAIWEADRVNPRNRVLLDVHVGVSWQI